MASKYKLYGHPVSPFSYLAHAALIYKKVDFDFIYIDLATGKQKESEFLNMHPHGQVPILVTDKGQNIYESWSIFEFLEEQFPEQNMLPKSQPDRAKVRTLCQVICTGIIPTARELFMEALGRQKLTDEERTNHQQNLITKLEVFEKELATLQDENSFNAVDPLFYQAWQNLNIAYPKVKELLPNLQANFERIAKTPTVISIESNPAVKQVRDFMASRFAIAK